MSPLLFFFILLLGGGALIFGGTKLEGKGQLPLLGAGLILVLIAGYGIFTALL